MPALASFGRRHQVITMRDAPPAHVPVSPWSPCQSALFCLHTALGSRIMNMRDRMQYVMKTHIGAAEVRMMLSVLRFRGEHAPVVLGDGESEEAAEEPEERLFLVSVRLVSVTPVWSAPPRGPQWPPTARH